ncbi:MAG TPA: hypothetical protein DSN98_00400 [Thermoplasmata archaeon]|jgi:hypothetical protein|nr:MAG TPA: hypothetical protein DSN98_00400 [Thermoplasmata archaeon]
MLRKSILKAALVIIIALAMIIPASAINTKTKTLSVVSPQPITTNRDIIFEDSFEAYDDWLIDFPPWTCIDVDGSVTFTHTGYTWPHQLEPQAFIIFNPATTVPPSTEAAMAPHTGAKEAMAINDDNTGYVSDDWLITPQLSGSYDSVTFWAHSYSSQYNLERITVCVSTTDTDPASFTMISPDPYLTVPLDWTEYTYDISSYSGQAIYIGIHYMSTDSWMLFLDDFQVTGSAGDATPPVTTCTLEGTMDGEIYTSDVTVTLTATDDMSGVNYTRYKVDGGEWNIYTAPFVVSGNGEHIVAFYSADIAGNIETEKSATFTIQYPIEITIKGGMGVSAVIKNTGSSDLTDIAWSISLKGGILLKANQTSGNILQLAAGASTTKKLPVLGFGKTTITVLVNGIPKTGQGFIFLFFALGVK